MKHLHLFNELLRRLIAFWFNFRLGMRMAVIVVIGTIALLALFAYLGTAALSQVTQRNLEERVILARTMARHVDYVITNIEDALTEIAAQGDWADGAPTASALEMAYRRLDTFATQVFRLDANGYAIVAYPPIASPVSFTQFAAVTNALGGQPFGVSRYRRPLNTLGASTIAVAPTRDRNNRVNGALAVSINLTGPSIQIFTQPIGLGETGYMDLIDLSGAILASTRQERIGHDSDHGDILSGVIRARRPIVSACHNCHVPDPKVPEREVLAFAPLERAQWGVTVRQSEDEVFAATRELQTRIFAFMAIMLIGALMLVYLTTRSVIAPVQALTTATQRIAAGDLRTPVPAPGRDEISALARSFDTMRLRLKDLIEETQEWNRELEMRVQESTAAIRAALEENKRLYAELQQREQMRGELLHRLISAQEEERKRISRELHDETCQILTGLEYALDNASEAAALEEVKPQLEHMHTIAETALEGVHRLIFDLRPSMLDHLGMVPALRSYAETRLNGTGVRVKIREVGKPVRLPSDVETAIYRVVQEALNNIARHACARNAALTFEFTGDWVEIQIADDGRGFDAKSLASAPDGKRGLGLMGMKERMSVIGGEFHLRSEPGGGTTIGLVAPTSEKNNGKD